MSSIIQQDINRILVALDPCRQNTVVLEHALLLAEHRRVELIALFVEDENLLRLAGLPFAREVHHTSAMGRKLDSTQMSRILQRQAKSLRQLLDCSAGQRNIQTSLRVVQGQFMPTAMAAAVDTDVTFLTVADSSYGIAPVNRFHLAVTAKPKPVWVFFNGTPESIRALTLATELSGLQTIDIVLLLPAKNLAQSHALQQQAEQILIQAQAQVKAQYIILAENQLPELTQLIRRQGCSLLVLQRDNPLMADRSTVQTIERLGCPIVLVR